jgi:hypothetical protein
MPELEISWPSDKKRRGGRLGKRAGRRAREREEEGASRREEATGGGREGATGGGREGATGEGRAGGSQKGMWRSCTVPKTLCIYVFPNGTVWPRSHIPHSCICERLIYSQDQSAIWLQQK